MSFLSSLYNSIFGKNVIDIDDMSKNEILNYLKKKEIVKLNVNHPEYMDIVKSVNVNREELLSIECDLYDKLYKELGAYNKGQQTKNPLIKKKYNVKPNFNKEEYDKCESNRTVHSQIKNGLNFKINIKEPCVLCNNNNITINEFNETFRDGQYKMDMFGIGKNMLKDLSQVIRQHIVNKYNEILTDPKKYMNFNVGKVTFAYKVNKKGERSNINSFRQVIGIPNVVSHLHRILMLRLNNYMIKNNYIDTTMQKGGVSGIKNNMFEQIIKLKNIIKNANIHKKELCVMFVDISDAFPSLNIEKLLMILKEYGIPQNLIDYIQAYYGSFTYYTSTNEWNSDNKQWDRGLLQGCPLSPLLFVIVLNYILKYLEDKYLNNSGYQPNDKIKILFSAYIDDIVITCKNCEKMNIVYNELKILLHDFGLKINDAKTAYMNINNASPNLLENVEVTKYKYLGEWIYSDGSSINAIRNLLYILRSRLMWIDNNANTTIDQKYQYITNIIIPFVQRKFAVMYDVVVEEKLKILKLIKSFTNKWGVVNDAEIFIAFNIKELLNETNDEILKNLVFEDNAYNIDAVNENDVKRKFSQIKFEYDNIDHEINYDAIDELKLD